MSEQTVIVKDIEDCDLKGATSLLKAEGFFGTARVLQDIAAQAKPSKPEEPTGHLAVVEDIRGVRWVNWRDPRDGLTAHERAWQSAEMDTEEWRDYRDIDAVRVLSEGVTA